MAYLLDSNVFIQAKNLYYGMDFCPAFWEWLVNANQAGSVLSIQKVRDELLAGDDELADWARQRGEEFFLPLGEDTDSLHRHESEVHVTVRDAAPFAGEICPR